MTNKLLITPYREEKNEEGKKKGTERSLSEE